MQRLALSLAAFGVAVLTGCSGRFDELPAPADTADGTDANDPPTDIADVSVVDAPPTIADVSVVDAPGLADGSNAEASLAPDAPPGPDATAQDASSDAAWIDAATSVEASAVDASGDGSSDARYGCYLEGHIYCPIDTWCPIGTCPDGVTQYGCTCNADGTTTCSLDCPT
jgi:hypothetical protein